MAKAKERSGFWDYNVPADMDGPERAAHFLDWAARMFPNRPVPAEHIVRVAFNQPRLPKEDSPDVESFRSNKMARVRAILKNEYKRALVYHPGMGWRASTDSEDIVVNDLEKKRKRVQSSIKSFRSSRDLVKVSELKDKVIRSRFASLDDALTQLESPKIQLRLAAPTEDKKPDSEK
jgi:hypothetical protein